MPKIKLSGHLDKVAKIRMTYELWGRFTDYAKTQKVTPSAIVRKMIIDLLNQDVEKAKSGEL